MKNLCREMKHLYLCAEQNNRMMKRIFTILLIFTSIQLHAQTEGIQISFDGPSRKDFGGYILDMGTMLNAESLTVPISLPSLSLLAPMENVSPYQFNPEVFRIHLNITYTSSLGTSPMNTSGFSVLYPGIGSSMVNWQGKSYKLNNGARINLYGEYDADGHKVHNPTAMPWQKKDFNAAFEFKSASGNFGVKLEVHGGRNGY